MKADEQLKCKDCDWYGSCKYYEQRKETSQICKAFNNTWKFVAELEQIKEEIRNKKDGYDKYSVCDSCIKIIDKHISKLKGESEEEE